LLGHDLLSDTERDSPFPPTHALVPLVVLPPLKCSGKCPLARELFSWQPFRWGADEALDISPRAATREITASNLKALSILLILETEMNSESTLLQKKYPYNVLPSYENLQSTWTAKLSVIAIQQVLFRKGHEFPRPNELGSFQGTCSRECPVGSTRVLILDGSDSTEGNPVDMVGKLHVRFLQETCHVRGGFLIWKSRWLSNNLGTVLSQRVQLMKLIQRHVRKLIVSQRKRGSRNSCCCELQWVLINEKLYPYR
jgi:hypothetical protein